MESQDRSVEPGPRGEPGEEFTTETSLPLLHGFQELPSRFQCRQTLGTAGFVRINTAIHAVARGMGVPLQDQAPCFIQDARQSTKPG
jgi:hypothetical protein